MTRLHGLEELGVAGPGTGSADVVPRAEAAPVGLHDHDLDRVVGLSVLQAVLDVPHERRVLGVRLLRPVEDDPRYGTVLLVDDGLELLAFHHCHLSWKSGTRRCDSRDATP